MNEIGTGSIFSSNKFKSNHAVDLHSTFLFFVCFLVNNK